MSNLQSVLPQDTTVNIEGNAGQIAIGNYIVQIGSVHGGVVNVAMPQEQPRPKLRQTPVFLRPRRFPGLLGRQAETRTATTALEMAQPAEFYATTGFGKTSLLRHLAYQLPPTLGPEGVIFLSARQQPLDDLLQSLYDAFFECDVPFKPTEGQLRHALQTRQALIILDDVTLPRDAVEQVLNMLPGCIFLLASPKQRLWGEGQPMLLSGLAQDEAVTLLERELRRPLEPAEQPVARALCKALDGHPLRVLQIAAHVRERPKALVDLIRKVRQRELDTAVPQQLLAALPAREQQVVKLLAGVGGAPLALEHLTDLTGQDNLAPVLQRLQRRHLIQSHSPRYSLTGGFSQMLAQNWDTLAISEQILNYMAGWAEQQQTTPGRLLDEAGTVLPLLQQAVDSERWPVALRLGQAMEGVLALNKRWGSWARTLQLSQQAAEASGNRAARAWALHQLGTRALCLDDGVTARTLLGRALRLREQIGDQAGAAITRHNLRILLGPPPSGSEPGPPDSGQPSGGTNGATVATPAAAGLDIGTVLVGSLMAMVAVAIAVAGLWALTSPVQPAASATAQSNITFSTPTPAAVAVESTNSPTVAAATTEPTVTTAPPTPIPPAAATAVPVLTLTPSATPLPNSTPSSTPTATNTPTATSIPPSATPTPTNTQPPVESSDICQPPDGWVIYIVQIGDSLNSLAQRTNSSAFELQQANCLESFTLFPNQQIYLPFTPPTPTATWTPTATFTPSATPTSFTPSPTATQPGRLGLNPARMAFPSQRVDTASKSQPVTVNNIGQGPLTLFDIILAGPNPGDFAIASNECGRRILAAGSDCLIWLNFRPNEPGTRRADLLVESSDDQPGVVGLAGSGLLPQPDLVVSALNTTGPARLDPKNERIVVALELVVENQGNEEAGQFMTPVRCMDSGQPCSFEAWLLLFETKTPLLPGQSTFFSGLGYIPLKHMARTVSIIAQADSCEMDCRIDESSETNNTRSINIQLPDMPAPNAPPQVDILDPDNKASYQYDGYDEKRSLAYKDLVLQGQAIDPEDGILAPQAMVWTTDRSDIQQAQLGFGSQIKVRLYADRSSTCGSVTHRITLAATDSNGSTSSAQRDITLWGLC